MTPRAEDAKRPGLLRDGRSILLRPLGREDLDELVAFHGRLSRQTIAMRLLGAVVHLSAAFLSRDLERTDDHLTIGAFFGTDLIGVGGITRLADEPARAEMTFTVEDEFQGLGLGALLLERVAAAARDLGVRVLQADVLPDNSRMLRTFAGSGYRIAQEHESSVVHVTLGLDPTARVAARADRREHVATRSSLYRLMNPGSVAVVGASRTPRSIGHAVVRNLVRHGFRGDVYPVNPNAGQIAGRPAYPSVTALPTPIDLVIVSVPAEAVSDVIADAAAMGAAAAVVLSAGFAEVGPEGRRRQEDLVGFVRSHGMRLLGPNCMGLVTATAPTSMIATFADVTVRPGKIAMSSESGPLGLAVLDHAARLGLGLSGFVSVGNSADVTTTDLLQWWEDDPRTAAVLLHVEQFGDPRTFARTARRVSARKPLVAVHPDDVGDDVVPTLFRQAGIIRAATLAELFDIGLLLATQPLPAGNGVAIVTNAGGPAALTAAAARAHGLRIVELADATRAEIRACAPAGADLSNPIDLTPHAGASHYRSVIERVLHDGNVDAVLALFVPPLVEHAPDVAAAISEAAESAPGKPLLASYLSRGGVDAALTRGDRIVPTFVWPESAAVALGRVAEYARWRSAPAGVVRDLPGIDRARAELVLHDSPPGWLDPPQVTALLDCFGIRSATDDYEEATGRDTIITVSHDPVFGPVVSFGVAGDYIDLFGDVARRITPLSDRDAAELVRSVRAFPLLSGGRGGPAYDVSAVEETVLRVSALVEFLPQIQELNLQVRLAARGAVAVAGRIRRRG